VAGPQSGSQIPGIEREHTKHRGRTKEEVELIDDQLMFGGTSFPIFRWVFQVPRLVSASTPASPIPYADAQNSRTDVTHTGANERDPSAGSRGSLTVTFDQRLGEVVTTSLHQTS
jgi:hypothetical protein